jgi:hypothetical protein
VDAGVRARYVCGGLHDADQTASQKTIMEALQRQIPSEGSNLCKKTERKTNPPLKKKHPRKRTYCSKVFDFSNGQSKFRSN